MRKLLGDIIAGLARLKKESGAPCDAPDFVMSRNQ